MIHNRSTATVKPLAVSRGFSSKSARRADVEGDRTTRGNDTAAPLVYVRPHCISALRADARTRLATPQAVKGTRKWQKYIDLTR